MPPNPNTPNVCRHRHVTEDIVTQGQNTFREETCIACGTTWRVDPCPTCQGEGWIDADDESNRQITAGAQLARIIDYAKEGDWEAIRHFAENELLASDED